MMFQNKRRDTSASFFRWELENTPFSGTEVATKEYPRIYFKVRSFFSKMGDILCIDVSMYGILRYFEFPQVYMLHLPSARGSTIARTLISKAPFPPKLYKIEKTDFSLKKESKTDPTWKNMLDLIW